MALADGRAAQARWMEDGRLVSKSQPMRCRVQGGLGFSCRSAGMKGPGHCCGLPQLRSVTPHLALLNSAQR